MPLLTERTIRSLKPAEKPYRRSDRNGLFIEVRPNGNMVWSMSYRVAGKQKTRKIGAYPDVGLAAARLELDRIRSEPDSAEEEGPRTELDDTWDRVGRRYQEMRVSEGIAEQTRKKLIWHLKVIGDAFGKKRLCETRTEDVLALCRLQEECGRRETSHRLRSTAQRVYDFGCAEGLARMESNPARFLTTALPKRQSEHYPAITDPVEVGRLMATVRGYEVSIIVRYGLLILAHTFQRPGEVRNGRWHEIDWKSRIWEIPAERMKKSRPQIVPLSDQVMEILTDLYRLTGSTEFLLPGNRSDERPLAQMIFNRTLQRIGYDRETHVPHGFRSTASTLLNEEGWNRDWIERQLSHVSNDNVRNAYNSAQYLEGRTRMMQAYSDLLDSLEAGDGPGRRRTAKTPSGA